MMRRLNQPRRDAKVRRDRLAISAYLRAPLRWVRTLGPAAAILGACGSVNPDPGGDPPPDEPTLTTDTDISDTDIDTDTDFTGTLPTDIFTDGGDTVTVTIDDRDTLERTYVITSTHAFRDGLPASGEVTVVEEPGQIVLRSGHDLFDALFALSIQEVRDNAVSSITDGAFDNGNAVPCDCFETGEKWKYVWTRDTAYAVDLSLAFLDPTRSANSLRFKLSDRKASAGGGSPQIVQDTGSGGSWPISSDRVTWTFGAREVLKFLQGQARTDFRDDAYTALVNTLEMDRLYVWDDEDGLYRGEQSFLDWREQTYPTWTADDVTSIASSKALSTNVAHWHALDTAAEWAAEVGDGVNEARYRGWGDDLKSAIEGLWMPDEGQYATFKGGDFDPSVLRKFDWLGASLAALYIGHGEEIVDSYPQGAFGPPVYWPQQPEIAIYHNRGSWPFVTAYGLRAAAAVGNDAVVDSGIDALYRGAALNLSNMENFDLLTGANWQDDGAFSGPVVNSRRQLWSVAGYASMVVRTVFGMEASEQGLRFSPFVTERLRREMFGNVDEISLYNLPYRGTTLDVTLSLPADPGGPMTGTTDWSTGGEVAIDLTETASAAMTEIVDDGDFEKIWSPREPNLTALEDNGGLLQLSFDDAGEAGVTFEVFRNGASVASGLTGPTWTDPDSADWSATHCYAVASVFSNGHTSQHSPAMCWWGDAYERIMTIDASAFVASGGVYNDAHGRWHYDQWGAPSDTLEVPALVAPVSGDVWIQLVYGNGAGPISTGITAAVKWVSIEDAYGVVAEGPIVMPQTGDWALWRDSTLLRANLQAGTSYRILIADGINMTYLEHFAPYTGGNGGGLDTYNAVNISEIKVLQR